MYTFVRQDMGLETLVPYSGTRDNPVQWIQFLHALDQPDLLGLPLVTPVKVQMLKCEKCSLEFCSLINYRRHCRIHRRSLKENKESHNFRGLLGELWDKCSLTERKQIVSYDGIALKKIPGTSVVEALVAALRYPGIWTLPQIYWKAGTKLLDIVQARAPAMSISSEDLFSILDATSEGTFLCTGSPESVQNFIFDGEVASGMEFRNLIASTSFLFELQLLKAWVAYKDAEALRCQKLLVEEEEAARRRQEKLVQRRKQKKLRQKELKVKERLYAQDINSNVSLPDEKTISEESIPFSPSESSSSPTNGLSDPDISIESVVLESNDSENSEVQVEVSECADQRISASFEPHEDLSGRQDFDIYRGHETNLQKGSSHSFLDNHDIHSQHDKYLEKNDLDLDGPPHNINIVGNNESEDRCASQLVIGSISVSLTSSTTSKRFPCPIDAKYEAHAKPATLDGCASEKLVKDDILFGSQKTGYNSASEVVVSSEAGIEAAQPEIQNHSVVSDLNATPIAIAKDFLTQRWKQAISSDHIKLSLAPELEPETATEVV